MKQTNQSPKIAFEKEPACDFFIILKERIHSLIQSNNLGPKAKMKGHLKTLFLVSVCLSFYTILIKTNFTPVGFVSFFAFFGFVAAISVMNISHDALHGSYASKSWVNRALGFFGDFFGPASFFWRKEHTVDHHIFTNIHEHDADLGTTTLLRLCPNQKFRKIHRFQIYYAPLLYCLNLIHWVFLSDFKRLYKIYFLENKKLPRPNLFELIMIGVFKTTHVTIFLVIPYLSHNFNFPLVLLGFLSFLAAIGLTLTTVFQLAHIVENVTFPLPNHEGKIPNTFAKHQLATTSNFGTSSKLTHFLFGGLNYQVEHHLFPHVHHSHLNKIAPTVQKTAQEYGIPYYCNSSFFSAVKSHFITLYRLGHPASNKVNIKPVKASQLN